MLIACNRRLVRNCVLSTYGVYCSSPGLPVPVCRCCASPSGSAVRRYAMLKALRTCCSFSFHAYWWQPCPTTWLTFRNPCPATCREQAGSESADPRTPQAVCSLSGSICKYVCGVLKEEMMANERGCDRQLTCDYTCHSSTMPAGVLKAGSTRRPIYYGEKGARSHRLNASLCNNK